ncbi:hypothetical protein [Dyella sp.]|uniref:hypothetical protein n=1 Tax=Dyella sp. TaxID=1869338 RepID=UPI002ED17A52
MRQFLPIPILVMAFAVTVSLPSRSSADEQVPVSPASPTPVCISARDMAGHDPCQASGGQATTGEPAAGRACPLESIYFSDCLAQYADVLVRDDPQQPQARALYRITVRQMPAGTQEHVDVLTGDQGEISDAVGSIRFTLATHRTAQGVVTDYRLAGSRQQEGSRRFATGDSASVQWDDTTITITRL